MRLSTRPYSPDQVAAKWLIDDFGAAVEGKTEEHVSAAITPLMEMFFFLDQAGHHDVYEKQTGEQRKRSFDASGCPAGLLN